TTTLPHTPVDVLAVAIRLTRGGATGFPVGDTLGAQVLDHRLGTHLQRAGDGPDRVTLTVQLSGLLVPLPATFPPTCSRLLLKGERTRRGWTRWRGLGRFGDDLIGDAERIANGRRVSGQDPLGDIAHVHQQVESVGNLSRRRDSGPHRLGVGR